jgi:anti-sigma regulatory factor (Ser/Thr protein kinase)
VAELSFTFVFKASGKDQFFTKLRSFAAENDWLPAITNEVELILEEWLTNVLDYGLNSRETPQLHVKIRTRGGVAKIEVEDNGIAFDPTLQKDPDLSIPAAKRPIGGLGIFMMKKLSRGIGYERQGEWNRLIIEKDLLKPVLRPKT